MAAATASASSTSTLSRGARARSTDRLNSPSQSFKPATLLRQLDQRPVHFAIVAIIATCVSLFVGAQRAEMDYFDDLFLDRFFQLRGAVSPAVVAEKLPHTRNIILVETKYHVPRALQVQLLRQLRLAKVVAFDFMFVNQEAQLNEEEKSAPWYRDAIQNWRRDNRELGSIIARDGNVVLGAWPEEEKIQVEGTGRTRLRYFWEKPPAVMWKSARYQAHLAVDPGPDGVTRHVRLFEKTDAKSDRLLPALGLALAAAAMDIPPREVEQAFVREGVLHLGDRRIPVDHDGRLTIDYVGGRESFEYATNHITYQRVLDFEPEDFRDKIVIIGESSWKSKEIFETPFGPMPGMQVHANIAATLLAARGAPQKIAPGQTALVALGAALLLIAPLLRWPLWTGVPIAFTIAAALLLSGGALFSFWHRVLPMAVPLLALALTYNLVALYEYRRTRETLGRFIGHEMVAPTLNVFSRLQPGGRLEEASALFCDLRGYSALSERLTPEVTSRLINQYTGALVKTVKRYGGRPIDYQGDGVFVLFERTLAGPEYSWRAIQAALALQNDFQILLGRWQDDVGAQNAAGLQVGIGIETGEMMIGLVGAEEHLKPGAVGDAVNVASRIQRLNTHCGFPVILTRATYDRVRENCERAGVVVTPCGMFEIRGREASIEVFGVGESLGNTIHLVPEVSSGGKLVL